MPCLMVGAWSATAEAAGPPTVSVPGFSIVSVTDQTNGAFRDIQYLVQNGSDPTSLFGVERISLAPIPIGSFLPPIILEPPLGGSAAFYKRGNAPGGADFQNSIAAVLATGGVDVYLISFRDSFLTPNECASQGSCAFAANWGFSAFVSDLTFIRALVAVDHTKQPAIGGASLGGIVGFAAVNQNPTDYAGLALMDSALWTTDTTLRAGYEQLCLGTEAAIAAGQVVSVFEPFEAEFVELELQNPNGPTPFPQFPAGTTNRQAYLLQLTTPSPGPPNSIFPPGAVGVAGSEPQNRLFFASESRINAKGLTDNFYAANAIVRDFACSLGGDETFVANLNQYTRPILALEDGKGLGSLADSTIALTGSKDVDKIVYANFGHSDLTETPLHAAVLEAPTIAWLYGDVAKF
ncbi:MAG TPA: hypothetical protein VKU41_07085 [Polyangiaceae bacterium]|nr:hypothetical protein [Polyangiaceae bacterium]